MALQIRRGTSATRTSITPDVGELIYTTDTKLVYVGDGTTAGGTVISGGGGGLANVVEDTTPQLGGNLDVNGNSIISTGGADININPSLGGDVVFHGNLVVDNLGNLSKTGQLNISSTTSTTFGNNTTLVDGNVILTRNSYANTFGAGFLFAQHHETVDAVNFTLYRSRGTGLVPTPVINGDDLADISFLGHSSSGRANGAAISAIVDGTPTAGNIPTKLTLVTNNGTTLAARAELSALGVWKINQLGALTGTTVSMPTGNNITVGDIKLDQNGLSTINTNASLTLSANGTGAVNVESLSIIGNTVDTTDSSNIRFLVSAAFANDVTVENDLRVTNKVYAESFISTSVGTPSIQSATNIELSAATGVVISGSPLRLASMTSSRRDALVAQNGDLIYNTTTNKFQGYENGAWVNLI